MLNDCKNLLILQDLQLLNNTEKNPHHALYQSTAHGVEFVHDFPLTQNLEVSFPSVYAKYLRRSKRMYEDISAADKVLFLWLTRLETQRTPNPILLEYQRKMSEKFGKEVDFLLIENDPAKKGTDIVEKVILSPHITLFKLDNTQQTSAIHPALANAALIEPILRQYRLNMPLLARGWSVIKGPFVRLASFLQPSKSARKAFRKKYFPEYQYRKDLKEIHQAIKKQKLGR